MPVGLQSCLLCAAGATTDANALDLDWLKENVRMAGSYNWSNVDLTQFPGSIHDLIYSIVMTTFD